MLSIFCGFTFFLQIHISCAYSEPVTTGTSETGVTFGPQTAGPRPLQAATSPRPVAVTPLVANFGPLKQAFEGMEYKMLNQNFEQQGTYFWEISVDLYMRLLNVFL